MNDLIAQTKKFFSKLKKDNINLGIYREAYGEGGDGTASGAICYGDGIPSTTACTAISKSCSEKCNTSAVKEKATIYGAAKLCKSVGCSKCPFLKKTKIKSECAFVDIMRNDTDKMNTRILQYLEKDKRTLQSEFLKRYPNAELDKYGVLTLCPKSLNTSIKFECDEFASPWPNMCERCKDNFWSRKIKD